MSNSSIEKSATPPRMFFFRLFRLIVPLLALLAVVVIGLVLAFTMSKPIVGITFGFVGAVLMGVVILIYQRQKYKRDMAQAGNARIIEVESTALGANNNTYQSDILNKSQENKMNDLIDNMFEDIAESRQFKKFSYKQKVEHLENEITDILNALGDEHITAETSIEALKKILENAGTDKQNINLALNQNVKTYRKHEMDQINELLGLKNTLLNTHQQELSEKKHNILNNFKKDLDNYKSKLKVAQNDFIQVLRRATSSGNGYIDENTVQIISNENKDKNNKTDFSSFAGSIITKLVEQANSIKQSNDGTEDKTLCDIITSLKAVKESYKETRQAIKGIKNNINETQKDIDYLKETCANIKGTNTNSPEKSSILSVSSDNNHVNETINNETSLIM